MVGTIEELMAKEALQTIEVRRSDMHLTSLQVASRGSHLGTHEMLQSRRGSWSLQGTAVSSTSASRCVDWTISVLCARNKRNCSLMLGLSTPQSAGIADTEEFHDADTGLPHLVQMPPGAGQVH